jgi:hypothetical protein
LTPNFDLFALSGDDRNFVSALSDLIIQYQTDSVRVYPERLEEKKEGGR